MQKDNKHYKRAERILKLNEEQKSSNFNRTQLFFIDTFHNDLPEEDFKAVKQLLKEYFAEKLEKRLNNEKKEGKGGQK